MFERLRGSSIYVGNAALQGFSTSIIYGLTYPLFVQYLNLPANQLGGIGSLLSLAWSPKSLISFTSDAFPICGFRRLPYLMMGFLICITVTISMAVVAFPEPYHDVDWENCTKIDTEVHNPNSRNEVGFYLAMIALWKMGTAWADCIIDALIIERSLLEKKSKRGTILATAKVCASGAKVFAYLFTGLVFNSVMFGGRFCFKVNINLCFWIFATVLILAATYAFIFTNEKNFQKREETKGSSYNLEKIKTLLLSSHYQKLLLFAILFSMLNFHTVAGYKVEKHWAKVEPLVKSIVYIISILLHILGVAIFMKKFLNTNWRLLVIITHVIVTLLELPIVTMTVFNIMRSQYLWFLDDIADGIISHWINLIINLITIEYATPGTEGICYAFYWGTYTISSSLSNSISNLMFSQFDIMEDYRYLNDSFSDRVVVYISFIIVYCGRMLVIAAVFLLPKQKAHAQKLKKNGEESTHKWYNVAFLIGIMVCFVLSFILNLLPQFKSTRCLMIAGGPGCK